MDKKKNSGIIFICIAKTDTKKGIKCFEFFLFKAKFLSMIAATERYSSTWILVEISDYIVNKYTNKKDCQ